MAATPLLRIENVDVFYGRIQALYTINLEVHSGELVCLLGGNASGKSTTLKTILGRCRITAGTVLLDGQSINRLSTQAIISRGVAIVPENRRIFTRMSVLENLEMGAYLRKDKPSVARDLEWILTLFPRLADRLDQPGMTLSGGEQQMLAMGRALMSRPRLLLMDEPSMGLSPLLVEHQFDLIKTINEQGTAIFMVEQNAAMALSIAHRGYVLQTGAIVLSGLAADLLCDPLMQEAYLGGDAACTTP